MTREAVNIVLDYCQDQGNAVQITFNQGEFIADFQHRLHAKVCYEEMKEKGIEVQFEPTIDSVSYYARLL